jgi:hypothetical protein
MTRSDPMNPDGPPWRRSSYSSGVGGECVECVLQDEITLIRDSKVMNGQIITVRPAAWAAFLQGVGTSA